MIFDDATLNRAYTFVSNLYEVGRHCSIADLKQIVLSSVSGLPVSPASLKEFQPELFLEGANPILFVIAALSELDRITGTRQIPPIELLDLMSHLLPISRQEANVIICHADNTLPLALWFASQGINIEFSGNFSYIPHIIALAGSHAKVSEAVDIYRPGCLHIALHSTGEHDSISPLLRRLFKSGFQGGVLLTNWSFLSAASPSHLQLKQRLVNSGALQGVIQFPAGIMQRMLPAVIVLGASDNSPEFLAQHKVRLVNAKNWAAPGRQGAMEMGYLTPILSQLDGVPQDIKEKWLPRPPMEEVCQQELMLRQCDLRMKDTTLVQQDRSVRTEPLGGCAALVRGQMLARKLSGEGQQTFREILLADLDEFGFITQASRVMSDAAPLPRSRRVARIHQHDILLTSKGSVQSIGKVGLVLECGENWLPSQTFYLIRSECLDPIWLFYFLRSASAQKYFKTHSSGTSVPQIQVADIAAINIPIPNPETLAAVHEYHGQVLKNIKKMQKVKEDTELLIDKSEQLIVSTCEEFN